VLFQTLAESRFTSSTDYPNVVAEGKRILEMDGGCQRGCADPPEKTYIGSKIDMKDFQT